MRGVALARFPPEISTLARACLAGTCVVATACASAAVDPAQNDMSGGGASEGRIEARPRPDGGQARSRPETPGLRAVSAREGALLYLPARYRPDRRWPLVVVLHGAGSNARSGLAPLRQLADDQGVILFAPRSRNRTWDAVLGAHGPDVASIDALLEQVFGRLSVDPDRLAIGGFSDGASYALSLGLANGDLFTDVIAFSPGFLPSGGRRERPAVYIAHGMSDPVLPIARTSRRIVPSLRRAGYPVDYREFDGGHAVPPEVARAALERFLGSRPVRGSTRPSSSS